MTQVRIDRATLEQLVAALEDSIDCVRHEYETYWGHGLPTRKAQIDSMKESLDRHEASITAGRAALANESTKSAPKPGFHDCTFDAAPQAQQMEPTDDQLVKGVKAMRLFVTKNSVADFKLGYMAALAAAPAPQPSTSQPLC